MVRGACVGTPAYTAPDVMEPPYEPIVDFWSLGICMYAMLTGDVPWDVEEGDQDALLEAVASQYIEPPDDVERATELILLGFLERDPDNRLGGGDTHVEDIKRHKFFAAIDWEALAEQKLKPPIVPGAGGVDQQPMKACEDNFVEDFTGQAPIITPLADVMIETIPQNLFEGFSFVTDTAILASDA